MIKEEKSNPQVIEDMCNLISRTGSKMNNTIDVIQNSQKTNYFIAKNIGIIRKEYLDSAKVWNLVRYNIVQ